MPARLLLICRGIPDCTSADMWTRQLGRLVRGCHQSAPSLGITVVAVEPRGASEAWLEQLGVDVITTCRPVPDVVGELDRNFDAVVIGDPFLAFAHASALRDLHPAASFAYAWGPRPSSLARATADEYADGAERLGLADIIDAFEAREGAVLGDADAVVALWEGLEGDLAPITPVPVLGLSSRGEAPVASAAYDQRNGLLHLGGFGSEIGSPDEAGFRRLVRLLPALEAANPGLELHVLGTDATPVLRTLATGVTCLSPDRGLGIERARVGVVARPYGVGPAPAALEYLERGLPFVTTSAGVQGLDAEAVEPFVVSGDDEMVDRITELHTDRRAWDDTYWHLRSLGESEQPDAPAATAAALLSALGLPVDHDALETVDREPPPSTARDGSAGRWAEGSIVQLDADIVDLEREMLPGPVLEDRALSHRMQATWTEAERYRAWLVTHHDHGDREAWIRSECASLVQRPKFSIVMPVYNTEPGLLRAAIESVRAQVYDDWELCIADDASTDIFTCHILFEYADRDSRVKVTRLDENRGIGGASNAALSMATGDFVGLLDHDDVLKPDALFWVAKLLERRPGVDLVYSDWEKIDEDGIPFEVFFKPDWSPDLFLEVNYLIHFTVLRRSLLETIGGWRAGFDGSQDYDLFLRATEATDRIAHLAKPLYGWRAARGSTANDIGAKPQAHTAGNRAVQEAVGRRGLDTVVEDGRAPTMHRVRRRLTETPLVTVIVPTRDRVDLLRGCVEGLREHTDYPRWEVLVVDNDSRDLETLDYLAGLACEDSARVVGYAHPFNYARQVNLGALHANGDLLLLLNNDVVVSSEHWMGALVEHAVRPEVGVVGARLLYPDGEPQHEGIVLGMGGVAYNLVSGDYFGMGRHTRDCAAVTGACLMTRGSAFWSVGGFDERLSVAFNDVDFCLRLGERGYRVVYTPYAELTHLESGTRESLHPPENEYLYRERWGGERGIRDPFIHPALDWVEPFALRI